MSKRVAGGPTRQFIVEGVDRLGKSTLIKNIMNELGYYLYIHYSKPEKLAKYENLEASPEFLFNAKAYRQMFEIIEDRHRIIFDRAHLGEIVYSPMYRGYSGDYVLDLEQEYDTSSARLILLTTSDFSFVEDDGLSHDFSRKEEEQAKFIAAFHASSIEDKVLIDVSAGNGKRKTPQEVLAEALKK